MPAQPAWRLNYAHGGWIRGDGPINAHRGEFVVNAAATAQNRAVLEAINSGGKASAGGAVIDERTFARAVARAINGATLIIDYRGRGQLIARESDL